MLLTDIKWLVTDWKPNSRPDQWMHWTFLTRQIMRPINIPCSGGHIAAVFIACPWKMFKRFKGSAAGCSALTAIRPRLKLRRRQSKEHLPFPDMLDQRFKEDAGRCSTGQGWAGSRCKCRGMRQRQGFQQGRSGCHSTQQWRHCHHAPILNRKKNDGMRGLLAPARFIFILSHVYTATIYRLVR